jgi:hypothetical protein
MHKTHISLKQFTFQPTPNSAFNTAPKQQTPTHTTKIKSKIGHFPPVRRTTMSPSSTNQKYKQKIQLTELLQAGSRNEAQNMRYETAICCLQIWGKHWVPNSGRKPSVQKGTYLLNFKEFRDKI